MEYNKISKLVKNSTVSKFVIRKWTEVSDLANGQYSVEKNISFKIPMLRPDSCEYSSVCNSWDSYL